MIYTIFTSYFSGTNNNHLRKVYIMKNVASTSPILPIKEKEFNNFLWRYWFNKEDGYTGYLTEKHIGIIQKDLNRINKLIAFI